MKNLLLSKEVNIYLLLVIATINESTVGDMADSFIQAAIDFLGDEKEEFEYAEKAEELLIIEIKNSI